MEELLKPLGRILRSLFLDSWRAAGAGLLLAGAILPTWGADVSIERVSSRFKDPADEPQNYLKITIDGRDFRCGILGDWKMLTRYAKMDVAAVPPDGSPALVGFRIERCVNKEGKAWTGFTEELMTPLLKRFKPEGARYEGENPDLSESPRLVETSFTRVDDSGVWKCRYQFRLVDDFLWIIMCEAPTSSFDEACRQYLVLTTTLCPVSSDAAPSR
jgi:hypothetical protein